MTPRKLSLSVATFPYGGNGGISNEYPKVGKFLRKAIDAAKADERIEGIYEADLSDTPITMTRNAAIYSAIQQGIDMLLMVDSDMHPDCEPDGKPFWESSFDFLYNHYDKGPCVVAAPYCGPPPNECVYVFRWTDLESHHPNCRGRLEMYARDHAAQMTGISNIGALPTGVILFDTRVFKLTEPKPCNDAEVLQQYKDGKLSDTEVLKLLRQHSWCYYEYTDSYQWKKSSTEDVTLTRDISMAGMTQLGYNPLFCNWDAWAGHVKPKIVRKPEYWDVNGINGQMKEAIMVGNNKRFETQHETLIHRNGQLAQ